MKCHLVVCMLFASAACVAGTAQTATQDEQKIAAQAKPSHPAQVKVPHAPTPVRHLSDAERAELRRQLQQFNRQYNKRS